MGFCPVLSAVLLLLVAVGVLRPEPIFPGQIDKEVFVSDSEKSKVVIYSRSYITSRQEEPVEWKRTNKVKVLSL